MAKGKEPEVRYISMPNPSLVQLNMRKMSQLYTRYAQLVLDLKKLRDDRKTMKKEVVQKISRLTSEFEELVRQVPRLKDKKLHIQPQKAKQEDAEERGVETEIIATTSFGSLKSEFERLRKELEKI